MFKLKCITIFHIILLAVKANSQLNIEPRFINAIDVVVKKSNTIVIFVVESKIELVASDTQTPTQFAPLHDVLKNKKLIFIKSTFEPGSTKDVVDKLTKINKNYKTFLAYFRTKNAQPVKASIVTETTRPVGLLGNLLSGLGIHNDDGGLLPSVLNLLGIATDEKQIEKVELEG